MKSIRQALLALGDVTCFVIGFFGFAIIGYDHHSFHSIVALHAFPFAIITALWMIVMFIFNFYELRASKPNMVFLRNFGIAAIIMLVIGFVFFYINPVSRISPKSNLIIFETLSLIFILIWRRIFYAATQDAFRTQFAVVCAEDTYHPLIEELTINPHFGFENRGTYKTLTDFINDSPVVDLLIVHKTTDQETTVLEKVLASHVEVISLAEAYETILYKIPVKFIDNTWIIHSISKSISLTYKFFSRIISILFAVVVLILTAPISLIIMIAIKINDGGPIFYGHIRSGLHGKPFMLYKFRSMIVDSEKNGAAWTAINDNRITRVGKITRKLHIDEIPQMWSLLTGKLALVGPRPERPEFIQELEKQIPYYFMRQSIAPGFTGWAQIKFRYARSIIDSQEKFEYDLFYIKNRNFFLDIGIILKTVQIIFTH